LDHVNLAWKLAVFVRLLNLLPQACNTMHQTRTFQAPTCARMVRSDCTAFCGYPLASLCSMVSRLSHVLCSEMWSHKLSSSFADFTAIFFCEPIQIA
jgi:hypothetical protein